MVRIELGPIPTEGLSVQEQEELRLQRINKIVNDKDGELRNADMKPHPFATYHICNVPCSDGQGTIRSCGELFASNSSAQEHQEKHRAEYMKRGYNVKVEA